jgi:Glutamine amidotransferases class-II
VKVGGTRAKKSAHFPANMPPTIKALLPLLIWTGSIHGFRVTSVDHTPTLRPELLDYAASCVEGPMRRQRGRNYREIFVGTNSHSISPSSTLLLCQLLGMNCAAPMQFALTWPDFCQRGGNTDVHADGWGLAYYVGHGLRQFHDVEAASTSLLAQFLGNLPTPIETRNMMAHIRHATSGEVQLANVHPFHRE